MFHVILLVLLLFVVSRLIYIYSFSKDSSKPGPLNENVNRLSSMHRNQKYTWKKIIRFIVCWQAGKQAMVCRVLEWSTHRVRSFSVLPIFFFLIFIYLFCICSYDFKEQMLSLNARVYVPMDITLQPNFRFFFVLVMAHALCCCTGNRVLYFRQTTTKLNYPNGNFTSPISPIANDPVFSSSHVASKIYKYVSMARHFGPKKKTTQEKINKITLTASWWLLRYFTFARY